MDEAKLEQYFKMDKTNWHSIDSDGDKFWHDSDKIKDFWKLIRKHKMAVKDYDFEGYVFPKFEHLLIDDKTFKINDRTFISRNSANFWNEGESISFNSYVNFNKAHFLGKTSFVRTTFKSVSFSHATFYENVYFINSKFNANVVFRSTIFNNKLDFKNSYFRTCEFSIVNFLSELKFSNCVFSDFLVFEKLQNEIDIYFVANRVEQMLEFRRVTFKKLDIIRLNKPNTSEKEDNFKPPILNFFECDFNTNTVFTEVDLTKLCVNRCDLSNIKFNLCHFNIDHGRLVLYNDLYNVKENEQNYRGLKRNFYESKDWEKSGYAYVSEMEMRRIRYKNEKQWHHYIIYSLYKNLSGYTQNYILPIKGLILLFMVSIIVYGLKFVILDLSEIIQASISNLLFIFKLPETIAFKISESNHSTFYWFFEYGVKFMSALLTTFLILALRKRFKQ